MTRSFLALAAFALLGTPARSEISPTAKFMRGLTDRRTVTREDCARVAAVFLADRDAGATGDAAWRVLRAKHVAGDDQADAPARIASRGYASLLFARALGENQSVFRLLLPWNERFAYKHLLSLGLVATGGPGTSITGPELVSLLALARRRQKLTGARTGSGA